MTSPRISPGTFRQLGPVNWALTRGLSRAAGVPDAHVFATLGRSGRLFRGWLHCTGMMMPFGLLSRRDTEAVIIRVATLRGCEYELDHHRRLGRKAGIDDALLADITDGTVADPRLALLLRATDEVVTHRDITDDTWQKLSEHVDERRCIALLMLIGQYDALATTIGTLRIQRDSA